LQDLDFEHVPRQQLYAYKAILLLRQGICAVTLVFLQMHSEFQVIIFMLTTLISICALLHIRPFHSKQKHYEQVAHELSCLLVIYLLFYMTDFNEYKTLAAYLFVGFLGLYISVNLIPQVVTTLWAALKTIFIWYRDYNIRVDEELAETQAEFELARSELYQTGKRARPQTDEPSLGAALTKSKKKKRSKKRRRKGPAKRRRGMPVDSDEDETPCTDGLQDLVIRKEFSLPSPFPVEEESKVPGDASLTGIDMVSQELSQIDDIRIEEEQPSLLIVQEDETIDEDPFQRQDEIVSESQVVGIRAETDLEQDQPDAQDETIPYSEAFAPRIEADLEQPEGHWLGDIRDSPRAPKKKKVVKRKRKSKKKGKKKVMPLKEETVNALEKDPAVRRDVQELNQLLGQAEP